MKEKLKIFLSGHCEKGLTSAEYISGNTIVIEPRRVKKHVVEQDQKIFF